MSTLPKSQSPQPVASALQKMQTPPGFPKLGVKGVRYGTYLIEEPKQAESKIRWAYAAAGAPVNQKFLDKPFRAARAFEGIRDHIKSPSPAYAMSSKMSGTGGSGKQNPLVQPSNTSDLSTIQHENFHDIMQQVERLHGRRARLNLARNLCDALIADPHAGSSFKWFRDAHVSQLYDKNHPLFNEEALAKLHDYLNDPSERASMGEVHFSDPNVPGHIPMTPLTGEVPRHLDVGIKHAFKRLQEHAANADESWLNRYAASIAKSESSSNIVSLIQAHNAQGQLLLGRRRDNHRYSLPGGHADPGESPEDCARRELKEETGLTPESLTPIRVVPAQKGRPELHLFSALVFGTPHSSNDPDHEVSSSDWEFVDIEGGIPDKFWDHLHGPDDDSGGDDNVVHQAYEPEGRPENETSADSDKDLQNVSKSEDLAKMAIKDIPKGTPLPREHGEVPSFDYNHALTPEHRANGYTLEVYETPGQSYESQLFHEGRRVGSVVGDLQEYPGQPIAIKPHSTLQREHQNQGLGRAMYEALYAHAFHNGVKRVSGSPHTEAASSVHQSLARRHGLAYAPDPADEDYPSYEHGRYNYALKSESEPLDKMAIADIPKGRLIPNEFGNRPHEINVQHHDYNHVLRPDHRQIGYTLHVEGEPGEYPFRSVLRHEGETVGMVYGDSTRTSRTGGSRRAIEPHSWLDEAHQGRGFGKALYEALYAHAFHGGIPYVAGGAHSTAASRVHQSLSQQHGLDYNPRKGSGRTYTLDPLDEEVGKPFETTLSHGPYEYAIKSEPLDKMAIKDLAPSEKPVMGGGFDYSHILPEHLRDKYTLSVRQHQNGPKNTVLYGQIRSKGLVRLHPSGELGGEQVGSLTSGVNHGQYKNPDYNNSLEIIESSIDPEHRGQGLGNALYEATMAHAYHKLGARQVKGSAHSTAANRVHASLSGKHSMDYKGALVHGASDSTSDWDARYKPYRYTMKAEGMPGTYCEGMPCSYGDDEICPDIDCSHNAGRIYPENPVSEAGTLLRHPDPVERSLALKLDTITPDDVATAAMDPDPMVWRLALQHPDANHAKAVLAHTVVLPHGEPAWERHDALLSDPDLSERLLEAMYNAVLGANLHPDERAQRLSAVASHPRFVATAWDSANGGEVMQKSVASWADKKIKSNSHKDSPADASREETMPHLKHLEHAYLKDRAYSEPKSLSDVGHGDSDNFASPKAIYRIRVDGYDEPRDFIVKPYSERESPLSGWAENTNQALYHAAGIGHLHQQTFTAPHGHADTLVPAQVIHLEEGKMPSTVAKSKTLQRHPDLEHDLRKIGVMDLLSDNFDRHGGNLIIRPNGKPMAIDHGGAFGYGRQKADSELRRYDFHPMGPLDSDGLKILANTDPAAYAVGNTFKWWGEHGRDIRNAFEKRLDLITDPETRDNLEYHFNRRADWLDQAAKTGDDKINDYVRASVRNPYYKDVKDRQWRSLNKALGSAKFLSHGIAVEPDHPAYGAHKPLIGTHPAVHNEKVEAFEEMNQSPTTVFPIKKGKAETGGSVPKAIYQHPTAGQFMVKPVGDRHTPFAGWNEATSQAAYHAGGIGYLHQASHHTADSGIATIPATVIHMAPKHRSWDSIQMDFDDSGDPSAMDRITNNPEHMESLRKIGLMDHVLGNSDRNTNNLMFGPNDQPLAIDNGLAMIYHHFGADNPDPVSFDWGANKNYNYMGSAAAAIGGLPSPETWSWWDANKGKIANAVNENINKIPHPEYRKNLRDQFQKKLNNLEAIRPGLSPQLRAPISGFGSTSANFNPADWNLGDT